MNNYVFLVFLVYVVYNILFLYFINENLKKIYRLLDRVIKPPKPSNVSFLVSQKENGMLKFVLVLPQAGAADVAFRKLTVKVGGAEAVEFNLAADVVESQEFECEDSAEVTGSLVDVDDAGNESVGRAFSFVITDTFAPPQPGEVGVKVTGESV